METKANQLNEHTLVNEQIRESIEQINQSLADNSNLSVQAMSYQAMAHALSLSLYNAVQQQQQMYVLQNATMTVAVKSALETSPKEAMDLINEVYANNNIVTTLSEIQQMIDDLHDKYGGSAKTLKAVKVKKKK